MLYNLPVVPCFVLSMFGCLIFFVFLCIREMSLAALVRLGNSSVYFNSET